MTGGASQQHARRGTEGFLVGVGFDFSVDFFDEQQQLPPSSDPPLSSFASGCMGVGAQHLNAGSWQHHPDGSNSSTPQSEIRNWEGRDFMAKLLWRGKWPKVKRASAVTVPV